jgi:DNA repair photolyase
LLRKQKRIDAWFVARYGMNLYRGCAHNCAYCDGRSEGYYVEGDFGKSISVKVNAPELLAKELDPERKRKPLKRAYIMMGGGVGDAYQQAESRFELARRCLEVIKARGFPVHVLTKSCLVERDLDLIKVIGRQSGAIVSMSFSTVDDRIAGRFEPGSQPPSRRLETLARCHREGIPCGMYLMPVIPFVTDHPEMVEAACERAREAGVDFVVFSGMTLKRGRQWDYFTKQLKVYHPELLSQYHVLYGESRWGNASRDYYESATALFTAVARRHRVNQRIPPRLYRDILDDNDSVAVMLAHLDYFHRAEGRRAPYGQAARAIASLETPVSALADLRSLSGVGFHAAKIIREIRETGRCEALDAFFY